MDSAIRLELRQLIQREVVLATGCTEPGAVALAVAKAVETLGCMPKHTQIFLSKNVFKNAMGVGIPGTNMIGLPIAVAMAITAGDSSRQLEVLTLDALKIDAAKRWLANNGDNISFSIKEACDKLYIECICSSDNDSARTIISGQHTRFVLVERNGSPLLDQRSECPTDPQQASSNASINLSMSLIFEYATTAPIDELEFINAAAEYNIKAADEGLKGYGLRVGQTILDNAQGDLVHTVVAHTVAASDARMDGCTLSVFSNSGSGNQGILCTIPPYKYGVLKGIDNEKITRALILSHLTSIYVKRGIGRLSALCGIVNASIGAMAGIVFLKGGSLQQVGFAIKNQINAVAGLVCDGAKPSCSLKMSTGLYSAFVCAELACNDVVVDATDGLSERDVDYSIRNLGHLGHDGMNQTDDVVLDIMTHKQL